MYIRKAKNYTKYTNEEKEKIVLGILAYLYIATIKESISESHFSSLILE